MSNVNLFDTFDQNVATVVSFGVRTMLISGGGFEGPLARKLAGLGCRLEILDELYSAIDHVMDDPFSYELIVIDCDSIGGLEMGQRAHNLLQTTRRSIPMILLSENCKDQVFPASRYEATILRAPLSAISLRVGFEHAMQDRLLLAVAS